ncbi:MAG: sodium:calcium antiporter [Chloroflexota bacterium]
MSKPETEANPSAEVENASPLGWIFIGVAAFLALPWAYTWLSGGQPQALTTVLLTGGAILGAAFLLSWAAEAFQIDVSQALALGLLALIAVLPEYAVDAAFAWQAAKDPSYAPYAIANMTGANRLLIGVGWSAVVLVAWLRGGGRSVHLERGNALELVTLLVATAYAFFIAWKGDLSLLDTVVLGSMFLLYFWGTSRAPAGQPHLVGPARNIGRLPRAQRRALTYFLFAYAALAILIAAEPFAHSLVEVGTALGLDEFLLVQWLAPLASEAPEFIVALLFAWRLQASAGLRTLVSSKVNQWTLLIATLPLVYSVGLGRVGALPLDDRQVQEVFLTAAQSLFATFLIAEFALTRGEALLLFLLFAVQLLLPNPEVRWLVSAVYLLLAVFFVITRPEMRRGLLHLPGLARQAVATPPPESAPREPG